MSRSKEEEVMGEGIAESEMEKLVLVLDLGCKSAVRLLPSTNLHGCKLTA